jgi:hypothetical protein
MVCSRISDKWKIRISEAEVRLLIAVHLFLVVTNTLMFAFVPQNDHRNYVHGIRARL